MRNYINKISAPRIGSGLVIAALAATSCVDHREIRNGVFNENVYLEKDFLTRENPHKPDSGDHSWMLWGIITKMSVPHNVPNAPYIGYGTGAKHVNFQFANNQLQMVDAVDYVDINKDSTGLKTVMQSWPGEHVDVKLRVNLDGEISNFKEENKEAAWEDRQYFKAQLEKGARSDMNMISWAMDDYYLQCLQFESAALVPGSFKVEEDADKLGDAKGDDYVTWTVAVTYALRIIDGQYYCPGLVQDQMGRSTFTYHIKYSLWRLPQSDYEPVEVTEKDPARKTVGFFDTSWSPEVYRDPKTDLIGVKTYLMRFDPKKPRTFYFAPNFPEKHKAHLRDTVSKQVNGVMEEIGAEMRIEFKDWNEDGKEREYGDPRYSWVAYHDLPENNGPIGMATFVYDNRTGEVWSTYLNMYDWGERLRAMVVQDYMAQITDDTFDSDKYKGKCTPGEQVKINLQKIEDSQKSTSLYSKLEDYMGEAPAQWVRKRSPDFHKYMAKLLPDLRFAAPWYNRYVGRQQLKSDLLAAQAKSREFEAITDRIEKGDNPLGTMDVTSPRAIERGLDLLKTTKDSVRNHFKLHDMKRALNKSMHVCGAESWELGKAMVRSARRCKDNGEWETREEWVDRIADEWFKVFSTHELGHDLGLAHNFYGSMDTAHQITRDPDTPEGKKYGNDLTSSIMEYAYTLAEGAEEPLFKPWDIMSLKYIYSGGKVAPKAEENWLYCTDEHVALSPLCTHHDIGTTPTEIVKNTIDMYEWQYHFRNFRAWRKLWSTGAYSSRMMSTLYPLRRFVNLWGIDWYEEGIKNNLKLLGVEGDERFFDNITNEFNDEMAQANRLIVNFYKAILQQSAGERSYATKFDKFYGDITQQGIIMDKYFAMFFHLGLWPVDDYDQNVYGHIAYHEYRFNSLFYSDAQDVTDSMIGGQYDVYPWFKPLAVLLFAQDTHDINFSDRSKREWIEMRKYERLQDMVDVFGFDPRGEALKASNPYQYFKDKLGREWIYYYMADRNQHLVASKDRNPVAFKILKDQNERINIDKSGSTTDFEIKYYLDYYQYFN